MSRARRVPFKLTQAQAELLLDLVRNRNVYGAELDEVRKIEKARPGWVMCGATSVDPASSRPYCFAWTLRDGELAAKQALTNFANSAGVES